jgi:pimeloyl-ACP methyl ester carboxylesterase
MTKRILLIVAALAVVLGVPLAVNALIVGDETKPARVYDGFIVRLPHHDDLQVREDGPASAPTLVLLHGFAASLRWWDPVTPALRAGGGGYHVVRLDLLGHGGSAKPGGGYSIEHQARLVDEALALLGVRRALVVGHSMGGLVATALAARDPRLVAGMVLVDSPPTESASHLPFLASLGFLPLIGPATRTLATDGMVRHALKSAFAPGYEVRAVYAGDYWRMTYTSYVDSHNASNAYLAREPLPRRLTAMHLPLLALYGTRDRLVSPSSERDYADVPGAQLAAIAGAGHSPMIEKPYATSRLILAFARRVLR